MITKSDRCEIVSHCGFELHFPDDQWYWASFYVSACHLHPSLKKNLSIFNISCLFLMLRCMLFVYFDIQFSCSVVSDSLQPHESQHARPPCPSPTLGVHSDSHPSSQWCHPPISSSVIPFSCPQSLSASESFPMSQLFPWGGQSTITPLSNILFANIFSHSVDYLFISLIVSFVVKKLLNLI